MKKRTLLVLLVAVFLMLVGAALFLFPIFTQNTVAKPTVYTVNADFQHIEIDLDKTDFAICLDDKTYIEINGYRESEYFISEEDGKLLLTDRSEKSPLLFKLSGIGKMIKESHQISDQNAKYVFHPCLQYHCFLGSVTVKVVIPLPLFTPTSPLWRATTLFTMASPIPFPWVAWDSSAW